MTFSIIRRLKYALLMLLTLALCACSLPTRKRAVPPDWIAKAEVLNMPGVRYIVGTEITDEQLSEGIDSIKKERAYLTALESSDNQKLPPVNFLALSGGGDDGAFGAGLLCGWTKSGLRPEFKLVTGVSTGALLAPFAFLGTKYDDALREVFTQVTPTDIMQKRSPLAALFDDALADNEPLGKLVAKYVTKDMLKEIAAEYAKGRTLLMATTNLDARQAVIWNMGKIAASDHAAALDLFHKIMLASSAIPGAFPPVMIDVEVNGKRYQEMHVDGGALSQAFVYPTTIKLSEVIKHQGLKRERRLYLIRNARLDPDREEVERSTLSIAGRAISALIQAQGVGDLYKIFTIARRDGLDYNLAYIPKDFNALHKEEFDRAYMQQLFQTGYELALKGYDWKKVPPGM